jgi:hypothetical protein
MSEVQSDLVENATAPERIHAEPSAPENLATSPCGVIHSTSGGVSCTASVTRLTNAPRSSGVDHKRLWASGLSLLAIASPNRRPRRSLRAIRQGSNSTGHEALRTEACRRHARNTADLGVFAGAPFQLPLGRSKREETFPGGHVRPRRLTTRLGEGTRERSEEIRQDLLRSVTSPSCAPVRPSSTVTSTPTRLCIHLQRERTQTARLLLRPGVRGGKHFRPVRPELRAARTLIDGGTATGGRLAPEGCAGASDHKQSAGELGLSRTRTCASSALRKRRSRSRSSGCTSGSSRTHTSGGSPDRSSRCSRASAKRHGPFTLRMQRLAHRFCSMAASAHNKRLFEGTCTSWLHSKRFILCKVMRGSITCAPEIRWGSCAPVGAGVYEFTCDS